MRPNFSIVLLISILTPAQAQELHPWAEELKPVFGVLQNAHLSGSIGLAGRCDPSQLPGFPQFNSTSIKTSSPLRALRAIAASDPGMRVKQDPNGTIRMTEKGVPNDILNVRISRIVFENYAHHDVHSANFAVQVILSTPEVRAFLAARAIDAPQLSGASGISGASGDHWPPDAPYISGSLDNVTVLEALDRVLAAFSGDVLVYWNCPKTREQSAAREHDKQMEGFTQFPDYSGSSPGDAQFLASFPAGLPNPFCIPRSFFSGLPQLFPMPQERKVFFYFFAMKSGYDEKMFVVIG